MKAALAYPTWAQVETGVARLCLDVERVHHRFRPTLVVGLARGGLVPAVRISHLLGDHVQFAAVSYSSPKGMGETADDVAGNTTSLVEVLSYWDGMEDKQVLIVDDIVDSGHTMQFVAKMFYKNEWSVTTACLHLRETSVFTPTFAWQTITKDDPWIVYPWEL